MRNPVKLDTPKTPEEGGNAIESFISNSELDGYSPKGRLTQKALVAIKNHKGDDETLRKNLVKSFGGNPDA